MQAPSAQTASDKLLLLGELHLAAVGQVTETRPLATGFQPTHDALRAAERGRAGAETALVGPRVAVRFAEATVEQVLRSIGGLAHGLDNNAVTGPAFKALFPDGLDLEIRPRGAAQVASARNVGNRLASQAAAARARDEWLGRLDAAMADLVTRLDARKAMGDALGVAGAAEDAARETWVAAYDSNAGAIRTLYPRRRAQQDLFFDDFRGKNAGDDDGGEGGNPVPDPAPTPA